MTRRSGGSEPPQRTIEFSCVVRSNRPRYIPNSKEQQELHKMEGGRRKIQHRENCLTQLHTPTVTRVTSKPQKPAVRPLDSTTVCRQKVQVTCSKAVGIGLYQPDGEPSKSQTTRSPTSKLVVKVVVVLLESPESIDSALLEETYWVRLHTRPPFDTTEGSCPARHRENHR